MGGMPVTQLLHNKVSIITSLLEDLSVFIAENCVDSFFASSISMVKILEEELSLQLDTASYYLSFLVCPPTSFACVA